MKDLVAWTVDHLAYGYAVNDAHNPDTDGPLVTAYTVQRVQTLMNGSMEMFIDFVGSSQGRMQSI